MRQAVPVSFWQRLSLYALLPLLLALTVLAGWATRNTAWITVVPEFPPMVPATAFLITATVAALLLEGRGRLLMAAVVVGYSGVLAFERLAGIDLGVLRWHPFDHDLVLALTSGARPARTTLTSFVLLGGGLALMGLPRGGRFKQMAPGAMASAVVAVTWTILLGYLVWAGNRADADYLAGIALPTGVSLLLLALGVAQASWREFSAAERNLALRWWLFIGWVALAAYVIDRRARVPLRAVSNGGELLLGGVLGIGTATLVAVALLASERSRLAREALARANVRLRERESALARSEELLRFARDGSLDAFLLLGAMRDQAGTVTDFTVLDANPRAAAMLGTPLAEVIGRPLSQLLPDDVGPLLHRDCTAVVSDGSPLEEERQLGGFGPTPRWIHQQVVRTGDGVAVTLRDVTAARELEQQFRHSQKIEAVGRLASGVAHDFNNMLAVVLGTTEELLADPTTSREQQRGLQTIRDVVVRGSELTARLSAFSRWQPSRRDAVAMDEVVQDVVGFARRTVPPSVGIEVSTRDEGMVVVADRLLLEQAVMNLLLNARDAMPEGGRVTITVDTVAVHAPLRHATGEVAAGQWCRLEVRDTGHGMSPEVMDKAFEPFFTTKPKGRGSGLGLSTAFGILRQAGGHLVVAESGPDGTAMQVYLPVAREAVAAVAPSPAAPVCGSGTRERVLVVDDEPQVRDVVRRLLERMGHEVATAADGDEGERMLREGSYSLLVTDMLMPGVSGAELGARARAHDPALRVIYISGFTDEQVGLDAGTRPRERFLAKPFTAAELMQAIEECR